MSRLEQLFSLQSFVMQIMVEAMLSSYSQRETGIHGSRMRMSCKVHIQFVPRKAPILTQLFPYTLHSGKTPVILSQAKFLVPASHYLLKASS
mmetsp:Transcript_27692/g.53841  ORF Transcript_27692/g.53841 Transcript_27692/m.53841 type:complete len:92 (-) Transcript_27692:589-864(-)